MSLIVQKDIQLVLLFIRFQVFYLDYFIISIVKVVVLNNIMKQELLLFLQVKLLSIERVFNLIKIYIVSMQLNLIMVM